MNDFRISFNDFINAQNLFLGWKRWVIQLLIIPVIAYLFLNTSINYYSSLLMSFILFLLAVFLIPSLNRKRLRKIYNSQMFLQKIISVKFNDDSVEWTTDASSDKLFWKDINKYKISRHIIIILSSSKLIHPVPLSAFESKDELNRFLNLLKKNR